MAALSNNKKDVYDWIHNIIKSSTKAQHILPCEKLVILFLEQYDDIILTDALLREITKMEQS